MKWNRMISFGLLLMGILLFAGCGSQAQPQEQETVSYTFTFANETGEDVVDLKLRPDETYDWSENLLTTDVWETGYEMPVTLTGELPESANGWQVQMTFADGTQAQWDGVNILDGGKTTFQANTKMEQETPDMQTE